jgi:hypothetical protein
VGIITVNFRTIFTTHIVRADNPPKLTAGQLVFFRELGQLSCLGTFISNMQLEALRLTDDRDPNKAEYFFALGTNQI